MRYARTFSWRRVMVPAVSFAVAATMLLGAPSSALAITRSEVVKRGKSWVTKKVPYSQSRYHKGYRQDCSGFVSMAWKLNTSYTTRSLPARATRVGLKKLKPGDAVWNPGHVVLFVKWKNKRQGTFVAYEEPSSGKTARRSIKKLSNRSIAYRRKGIKENPKPTPTPAPAPTDSLWTTPGVEPSLWPTQTGVPTAAAEPTITPMATLAAVEPVAVATARVWTPRSEL